MNITVHISQSQVTESLVNTRVNCLLDVVFVVIFFFFAVEMWFIFGAVGNEEYASICAGSKYPTNEKC